MTADLVPAADMSPAVVAWKVAQRICRTSFVPANFRNKPEETFAAILWGQDYGWNPIRSVNSVDVIQGKPTLKPEAMRALIRAAGHKIKTEEYTRVKVTLVGERCDTGETESVTWELTDAKDAELLGKDNWKHYPRAMLLARATAELARLLFADVIAGSSYTPDELGDDAAVIDVEASDLQLAEGGDRGPASELQSARLPAPDPTAQQSARRVTDGWNNAQKLDFMERFQLTDLADPWPDEAVVAALEAPF